LRGRRLDRLQTLQFPDAWRGPGLEEIQDDVAPTHPVQREAFSAFILDDDVRAAVAAAAGRFVRPGKELCRPLSGMSDPGPDVTIDLSPGNPCRQRRKSPALVDLVDLHHRRLCPAPDKGELRSADQLRTNLPTRKHADHRRRQQWVAVPYVRRLAQRSAGQA